MADDEDHGTGREGESPGQQRLRQGHRGDTDEAADRLDETGQQGDPEGADARILLAQQGDRDGEAFGEVLQPDADGQRGAVLDVAAAEADADRHPFREVVQGDGDDEQPDAAQRTARGLAVGAHDEVLVGQVLVDQPDGGDAEQDAADDDADGGHFAGALGLGGIEPRQNQREEGCGEHDAGGEAEQGVLDVAGDAFDEQCRYGADPGGHAGGQTGEKTDRDN